MDFEGALRARLLAASPRTYWVDRPQAAALPAAVLQKMGGRRDQHMKGFNDLRPTRVQFEAWALSFAAAKTLLEALIAAAVPENTSNGIIFNRALVDGEPQTLGERTETAFIHRHIVDLIFWWQAA